MYNKKGGDETWARNTSGYFTETLTNIKKECKKEDTYGMWTLYTSAERGEWEREIISTRAYNIELQCTVASKWLTDIYEVPPQGVVSERNKRVFLSWILCSIIENGMSVEDKV